MLNNINLTQNKLIVLYILNRIDIGISKPSLMQLALEASKSNYFSLAQGLSELIDAKQVKELQVEDKQYLLISNQGRDSINLFGKNLPKSLKETLDTSIIATMKLLKNERNIESFFKKIDDHDYRVTLRATEKETLLFELNLSVVSEAQANLILDHWESNSSKLYSKIIDALISIEDSSKPTKDR